MPSAGAAGGLAHSDTSREVGHAEPPKLACVAVATETGQHTDRLTRREHSSGKQRSLGRISRRGDRYLRTLLIHGARSALLAAHRAQKAGAELSALQRTALRLNERIGHNKATVALANKIARILWAVWTRDTAFDGNHARRSRGNVR